MEDQLRLIELKWQIGARVITIILIKVTLQREIFFKGQVHNKLVEGSLIMTAKEILLVEENSETVRYKRQGKKGIM